MVETADEFRTIRVKESTKTRLEDIQDSIRRERGKKMPLSELIERALDAMAEATTQQPRQLLQSTQFAELRSDQRTSVEDFIDLLLSDDEAMRDHLVGGLKVWKGMASEGLAHGKKASGKSSTDRRRRGTA